jgi:5-methylcytosine-specific restriction endonuclease McrA
MTRHFIARSVDNWSNLPLQKQLEYKLRLMEWDGLKCSLCGNGFSFNQLTIDHVLPVPMGGSVFEIRVR